MTGSYWNWLEWGWNATSLMLSLAVLVAAVVALRKIGGIGAILLLAGGAVELIGWGMSIGAGLFPSFADEMWGQFFLLGLWTTGSLLVVIGILLIVLRAGGMKRRLEELEAVVGVEADPARAAP